MVVYKIDLQKLEENYNSFSAWGEVFFPVKTNHNKIILSKLKRLGSGFECDSIEHIKKIYSKRNSHKIIFSNVAKSEQDIIWAAKHNIVFYTVDDEKTLRLILHYAKKYGLGHLKINLRLNIYDIFKKEFKAKGTKDSRLGASARTIKHLLGILDSEEEITIERGISFYVQAEVHDDKDMLLRVSGYIAKHFCKGNKLDFVNIGGGSDIYRLNYSKQIMFDNLKKLGVSKIVLEPGRYMVGDIEEMETNCTRSIYTDLNGGEYVLSMAVGIYHGLIDCKLHNRNFDIYIKVGERAEKLLPLQEGAPKAKGSKQKAKRLVLRGPTADSSDIVGIFEVPKLLLNAADNEKISFVIKNVGAYVEVLCSDFSGKIPVKYKIV